MRTSGNEVICPDMVLVLRPQPDTRTVVEPEASPFRLFLRDLEPFSSPDPLNPLVVNTPAPVSKQSGDPAVAVSSETTRKIDDLPGKRLFITGRFPPAPLRRSRLVKHPTCSALSYLQAGSNMTDAFAATGRAQKFPSAASFRISLSSVNSATARLSLAFSFSSRFSFFAWSRLKPRYSVRHR